MQLFPELNINDFDYNLPPERIAQFPLKSRDDSKLVVFHNQQISQSTFKKLIDFLPQNALMVVNETKVILARINFQKESGANIELFCLEPVFPTNEIQNAFKQTSGVTWKCLVGNSKKWKSGILKKTMSSGNTKLILYAKRKEIKEDHSLIEFTWDPESVTFSEILEISGTIPLPPYMQRDPLPEDEKRYQTVFAGPEGSVAAPTAGLHFTRPLLKKLAEHNITRAEVTLHVGAGTFKPVCAESIIQHEMHSEKIVIPKNTVKTILKHLHNPVIAIGTTTMRTIESLYWHGVKILVDQEEFARMDIRQWDPYFNKYNVGIPPEQAIETVLNKMEVYGLDELTGQTQLIIVPGYKFRIPDILITNFHMPKSTLLLLVSAFIGPNWKNVYEYALANDFRFLSYGDSCLFYRNEK